MILVIEPIVTGFSHEMVNSGFLYNIAIKHSSKDIVFIAESKHINSIQTIFESNGFSFNNIKYLKYDGILNKIKIIFLIYKYNKEHAIEKYIFLSFNGLTIRIIHLFIQKNPVFLVCHAIMESLIDNTNYRANFETKKNFKSIVQKIKSTNTSNLIQFVLSIIKNYFNKIINYFFNFKKIFLNTAKDNITYIVLSQHILDNLKRKKAIHNNKIVNFTMPYIFHTIYKKNFNVKLNQFGIIGFGNPIILKTILNFLNNSKLKNDFKFWNIGANSKGLENIPNLIFPVQNRYLTREEIKTYSQNLDFTLILYDGASYTLSCSASILESILYLKPIIYLNNSCINEFNKYGIGIMCNSLDELMYLIKDIIEFPENYVNQYENFLTNLNLLRNDLNLDNRNLIT